MLLIALVSLYYVNPKFFYVLALWFLVFSAFSMYMSNRLVALAHMHAGLNRRFLGGWLIASQIPSNIRLFARNVYGASRLKKYLNIATKNYQSQQMFAVFLLSSMRDDRYNATRVAFKNAHISLM